MIVKSALSFDIHRMSSLLLTPIVNLDLYESYSLQSILQIYFEDFDIQEYYVTPLKIEKPKIEVVNITATGSINKNIFYNECASTNVLKITDDFDPSSSINTYSKKITFNLNGEEIKGRLFQNCKIMLYTKSMNVTNVFNIVFKELRTMYPTNNLTYSDVSCNSMMQFNLPFMVSYRKCLNVIKVGTEFIGNNFRWKVNEIKEREKQDSGFLFYATNNDDETYSFNIFYSGTVQARYYVKMELVSKILVFCEEMYMALMSFRYLIEDEVNSFEKEALKKLAKKQCDRKHKKITGIKKEKK